MKTISEVYDVAYILDNYIIADTNDDTMGWVEGAVAGFEMDNKRDEMDIVMELPWGEQHHYGQDTSTMMSDGNLNVLCESYGYGVSEFEKLEGEPIYLKLRYLNVDDDGEIDSGTTINYTKANTDPSSIRYKVWSNMLQIAFYVAMLVLVMLLVLIII